MITMTELPSRAEVLAKLTDAERWALVEPHDPDVVTLRQARNHPPCPECGKDYFWTPGGTMLVCLGCALHPPVARYKRDDSGRNLLSPA
jgi:hypothetical protein